MVASGQFPIRRVKFASRLHPDLPIEVLTRGDLMRRLRRSYFAIPERPAFQMLLVVWRGDGQHTVDFTTIALRPGRMVRVHPGQVQAWDTTSDFEAAVVLARLATEAPPTGLSQHDVYRDLGRDSRATAEALVDCICREQKRFAGDEASARLLTTLFEALCRLFDRASPHAVRELPDAYVAFCEAVERRLSFRHSVRDLVRDLGYSERTVTRACQKVTGRSARALLNARILLEAKRLLAHTDKSAATISAELGFSEPTNFHKFFSRQTGQRPSQFRATSRRAV